MPELEILRFPDDRLRIVAQPVAALDRRIQQIIQDMLITMYEARGIGLAATQVNIPLRIVVMDVSEDKSQPLCLINPQLLDKQGSETMDEGCLSVPGFSESVTRAEMVRVKAWNERGEEIELEASGLLAVCIQHELDHLDGKLFVDYISSLKRERIRSRLEKSNKAKKM